MTFHFSDEGEERAQGGRIAQGGQISRLGFEAEDFSRLLARFPRSYGLHLMLSTAAFIGSNFEEGVRPGLHRFRGVRPN